MTSRRPALLAVTDHVGDNLSNGAQVFADALLSELTRWYDVTAVVHSNGGSPSDRRYRVLDSSVARRGEPLTDWLSRTLRGAPVDLVYNLGGTAFACSVSTILAHWYRGARLINHFQVNLAAYATHEGAEDDQIRDLALLQRTVAQQGKRNVFPSFAEMSHGPLAERMADGSCVVVNPFVDAGASLEDKPERPFTFFAAGRFADYVKGGDLLFRAFATVHRRHADARLETASDEPRFSELLNGASRAWTEHGWLDRHALHCAMRDADVVVVPSRYEPFGLVALEAMAMGTPVIAMEVGGLGEMIHHGKTGWLTKPEDGSLGLSAAMERAIANRPLARRLGRNARRHVRREYSLARVASHVRVLLDNALVDAVTRDDVG